MKLALHQFFFFGQILRYMIIQKIAYPTFNFLKHFLLRYTDRKQFIYCSHKETKDVTHPWTWLRSRKTAELRGLKLV